jgi:hypothetical protein
MPHQETPHEKFSLKHYFVPLTTSKAIHFIIIIGIIVFFNSLFNSFLFDDQALILQNLSVHSLSGIPNIFQGTIQSVYTNDYYRPVVLTFYALLYTFFQENTFYYHLVQLALHISNTILVFIIFKKFLKQSLAFFLSLLFLIHPINESTVVYISNLPDTLFIFFGLLSLLLLQREKNEVRTIIAASVCLLLCLFSKETGIAFLIISYLYLYLFKKNKLFVHTLASIIVILVYIIARVNAHVPLQKDTLEPIMTLSLTQRLLNIPAIISYYIQTFLYPKDLVLLHSWTVLSVQFNNFFFPLITDSFFFILLLIMSFFVYRKTKEYKWEFFFFVWFLLGMLLHAQIVPIDFTVSDHFFYFPIIGLLALIGLFIQNILINKKIKTILIFLGILLICILSLRTMIRNLDWKNQSTILAHDEKLSHNDYEQELLYGVDLINQNRINEGILHIKESITLYPQSFIAWDTLGAAYLKKGDVKKAKKYLNYSISLNNSYFLTYEHMAQLLWEYDTTISTKNFTGRATVLFPYSEKLWYYNFLSNYALGNYNAALISAKNYYLLTQNYESYQIYYRMVNKLPIHLVK